MLGVPLDSPAPGTKPPPRRLQLDERNLENYLKSLGMEDSGVLILNEKVKGNIMFLIMSSFYECNI